MDGRKPSIPAGASTPAASTPSRLALRVALDLRGGDVWAWEKRITGTCAGVPADAPVSLLVNGAPVPANREGDTFAAVTRLRPGPNTVVAVAELPDGERITSAPVTHTVRLEPRPTARIDVRTTGDSLILDGGASETCPLDDAPIRQWSWRERDGNPGPLLPARTARNAGARLAMPVPAAEGTYGVTLEATDARGRRDVADACVVVEDGAARALEPASAWASRAVVYGVDVRSFSGNGLPGVTERLKSLRDLGVTAIWLSPVTAAQPGDFGYGVVDYFAIREAYGTIEDLRALVDAADACDLRVLMDMVPNHTSRHHPYFLDAERWGAASPYRDFFERDERGEVTHYFNWTGLANLNLDNPEVRRFITETFTFWMRECGIDGFRVDAAWGIRERRPDYWREWSAELRRIKADALLIAEASARDPFYADNGFDAAYDWTDELGVWAWADAFAGEVPASVALRDILARDPAHSEPAPLVFRFLNNNDTGERFIATHGPDAYRVALAMLLTLPGIPCLYTGDETGATYQPYAGATPIDRADRHDLRAFVTRLIRLQHDEPALHARAWELLDAAPASSVLAYLRQRDDGRDAVTVVLNHSPSDVDATVALPTPGRQDAHADVVDLWSGERQPGFSGGTLTVPVAGWGFRLLKGVAA